MEKRSRPSDEQFKVDVYQYLLDNQLGIIEDIKPQVVGLIKNKSLFQNSPGFLNAYIKNLNDFIYGTLSVHIARSFNADIESAKIALSDIKEDLYEYFFREELYQ